MLRDVKIDIPHDIPQVILLEGNELQRMRYVAGCYFYSLRAEKVIRVYIGFIYIVVSKNYPQSPAKSEKSFLTLFLSTHHECGMFVEMATKPPAHIPQISRITCEYPEGLE